MHTTETLIIGGGLSGLHAAYQLQKKQHDFILVEARSRLGGRILSETYLSKVNKTSAFDLGPAWYWPGQNLMADLVQELNIQSFEQHTAGDALYEDPNTRAERIPGGFGGSPTSYRIRGGAAQLISALAEHLPSEKVLTNNAIDTLHYQDGQISASIQKDDTNDLNIQAKQVVLAVPPRLATHSIHFLPNLPDAVRNAFQNTPTWMASHAKAVAVYETAFWRETNLSGDAFSRIGPLVEIHDASASDEGLYALFGFFGIGAQTRSNIDENTLRNTVTEQLTRLFGQEAAHPETVFITDWSREQYTATPTDQQAPSHHPAYGPPAGSDQLWDGKLQFCSTEMSRHDGGLLEGALYASLAAIKTLP